MKFMILSLFTLYMVFTVLGCGVLWPNTVKVIIKMDESSTVEELTQVYIKANTKGSGYNYSEKVTIARGTDSTELTLDYYGLKTEAKIYATYAISNTKFQSGVCSVADIDNTEPKTYTISYNGTLSCK